MAWKKGFVTYLDIWGKPGRWVVGFWFKVLFQGVPNLIESYPGRVRGVYYGKSGSCTDSLMYQISPQCNFPPWSEHLCPQLGFCFSHRCELSEKSMGLCMKILPGLGPQSVFSFPLDLLILLRPSKSAIL